MTNEKAEKRRPGRRSLSGGSPLAHTSITAFPEQFIFYLILSGDNRSVSAGVQKLPEMVAKKSPFKEDWEQAQWMVERAKAMIGGEATLQKVYQYVSDNFDDLSEQWRNK